MMQRLRSEHKELSSLILRATEIAGKQGLSEKIQFGQGTKTWGNAYSIADFMKYEGEMIGF